MTLRIDKSGRIVVPKPIKERLGLKPDVEVEAVEQPGGILLRPVEQRPSMVKVDGLWVHQGVAQLVRLGIVSLTICARSGFNPF